MTKHSDVQTDQTIEDIGDAHVGTSELTHLKENAFDLSDDEKIVIIKEHFAKIMDTLGLDLTDDSLKGTPQRVAKMYVKEIFKGLNPKSFDENANYSFGIKEHVIFPEVNFDKVDKVRGLDITIVTNTNNKNEAKALMVSFNFPFFKKGTR